MLSSIGALNDFSLKNYFGLFNLHSFERRRGGRREERSREVRREERGKERRRETL